MRRVVLASETDFDGWRRAARRLRAHGVSPEAVVFDTGAGEAELFAGDPEPEAAPAADAAFSVPAAFLELAQDVVRHRAPHRFALLYRLLWRMKARPALLEDETDPDVGAAYGLAKAVRKEAYRMQAYVRFRETAEGTWIAWMEPEQRVVELAALFFVRRFPNMRWSILTPDRCAHWDGEALTFTDGVGRDAAPASDGVEDWWRAYYAATFNPARLKVKAMTAQMPKRLWRNLPEAEVIPALIADAETRTGRMVAQPPTTPAGATRARARPAPKALDPAPESPDTAEAVWAAVQACRRCDLWRHATQGVAGRGPSDARLMFVGEQPGDQEDLAGEPFVGPAGELFDRALAEAGADRAQAYVTNAVKHFKYEPRGKRRVHAKPGAGEISACRWWLEHERAIVKPKVIVALGATAGRSVFGRPVAVNRERGAPVLLEDGATGVLTVHPSYMLRLPDAEERARAYALFVEDLRTVWALAAAA